MIINIIIIIFSGDSQAVLKETSMLFLVWLGFSSEVR